jgi:putative beta-lysine N-acetyltransferase
MSDIIESFGASLVQHGPENDRAYLMKLDANDLPTILPRLDSLGRQQGYSKLFAKVPATASELFIADGFEVEACVPDFYKGSEDGVFLGKYLQEDRATETQPKLVEEILQAAAARSVGEVATLPSSTPGCERLHPEDTADMADIYREVFATYPFPIHDPAYLEETMQQDVFYYGIRGEDGLLAVASAEVDFTALNAEMTDFATRPEARGAGLATTLLGTMESSMRSEGIRTAYTIARAYSFGMNITFARHNYIYSGTLTNNTQISGGLESMNVWHKAL